MAESVQTTVIPQVRQVIYTTYASFPTTGLTVGDLAYATDTGILYRWNGSSWDAITTPAPFTSGTYTGDSTANRAIPHGLGAIPDLVFIVDESNKMIHFHLKSGITRWTSSYIFKTVTASDATNIYVGNATDYLTSANNTGLTYRWVAFKA